MRSFLLALQFLTILPLKIEEVSEKKMARSLVYFPLAGVLIGSFLAGLNMLLSGLNFSPLTLNIILVVALMGITGGIHLDGLSDTADAFLSGKTKQEMLVIMRDPHIGAMGVLSLIGAILLKIAFLLSINSALKTISLLLMCVLSRWVLVLSIFLFPYARDQGKAKVFSQGINKKIFILSTAIAVACAFAIWQIRGLSVLLIIGVFAAIFGKFISSKIGGITGDTLGALNELTEIAVLCIVVILGGGS